MDLRVPGDTCRFLGGILKRPPFPALLSGYRPVTRLVKDRFAGRFTESNRRLAALTGGTLDLSDYR